MIAEVIFITALVGSWGLIIHEYNEDFSTRGTRKRKLKNSIHKRYK